MTKTINFNGHFINFGIPFSLFGILVLFMQLSLPQNNTQLDIAFSLDLLFTIPLIYFLLIRKSSIPNTTVVPMMVLGLLLGTYYLPTESQFYLTLFREWGLPLIELGVVSFIVFKVYRTIKEYQRRKGSNPDFYSTLNATCQDILPQGIAPFLANEVAVFYYGFIDWKTRSLEPNEFSYHKKSGSPALFGALIFIIFVETIAVHLLLEQWSVVVAWVLTSLSLYTGIQFLGFAKSLMKRPIVITNEKLILRYGILAEATIPLTIIERIELSRKALGEDELARKLSPLGELESHNVIIRLKGPLELKGLYGSKKVATTIALYLDEPMAFKEQFESAIA